MIFTVATNGVMGCVDDPCREELLAYRATTTICEG
jgi:hypothetical protein